MIPDHQCAERGITGSYPVDVARTGEHRSDPGVVLLTGRGDVAVPPVACEEYIRDVGPEDRLLDYTAHAAGGVVLALLPRGVEGDEIVLKPRPGYGLDRH